MFTGFNIPLNPQSIIQSINQSIYNFVFISIIFTAITTGFKAEERPCVFLPFLFLGRRS